MAAQDDPAGKVLPAQRGLSSLCLGCRIDGRPERVERKGVFQVGDHQLLVLLLMVQAQFDQRRACLPGGVVRPVGEGGDGIIHIGAVSGDFSHGRPGHEAAMGARILRADSLVVGVEEIVIGRIYDLIGRIMRLEHESLEEPGRVGPVPAGGACLLH